jgi:hypothetical protein
MMFISHTLCSANPEYPDPVSVIQGPHMRLVKHETGNLDPFFSQWIIYGNQTSNKSRGIARIRWQSDEVVAIFNSGLNTSETAEFDRLMTAFVSRYVELVNAPKALIFRVLYPAMSLQKSATQRGGFCEFQERVCKFTEVSRVLDVEIPGGQGYTIDFQNVKNCVVDSDNIVFEKGGSGINIQNGSNDAWWNYAKDIFTATFIVALIGTFVAYRKPLWNWFLVLFQQLGGDGWL